MIPLRLTVKNFMCYRDNVPPLDLEGIHVACLCGGNGHGKTALLDAITWALWGRSRAPTQDELIHQGQQDMAVELEFLALEQRYRVIRRHSRPVRGRQGTTLLELQVTTDNGTRPITGNTVSDTEARIREVIHLDYDTFVNTAFLLQGRADLFTSSSPSTRKELLAEVLDLSYYQKLEERAKERSRTVYDKAREADSAIALRRPEAANRPEYEEKLTSVNATLDRIGPEFESYRGKSDSLREAVESLRSRRYELGELTGRVESRRGEIAELERQVQVNQDRVSQYEAALEREPKVREQYARLEETRAELDRLDQALARKSELDRERAELEKEVAVQRERLSAQADQLRNRIAQDLEPKATRIPVVEEELRAATQEQAKLGEVEGVLRQRRDEAQNISSRLGYLEETNTNRLREMEETRQKFDMLDVSEALCPLCKQPLGSEGKEHLRLEYESQGTEAKQEYQRNTEEQDHLKQTRDVLMAQVSKQETELDQRRQQAQTRVAAQERELAECQSARGGLTTAAKELEGLQQQLDTSGFAQEQRQRLGQLDGELAALGYSDEIHRRAREQVRELEPFAGLHNKLLEAHEALPKEREALSAARQMLGRRQQEEERDERRRKDLAQELESLPSFESELEEANSRYQALEKQRQDGLVQQRVLTEQIDRCSTLEEELRELDKERRRLEEEQSVYDQLAVAFGKNGVQALIIETAIPQIQDDANELLGRLTDHRMSLKVQLQEGRRESRTGQPSEELQIKISDEVGTRSYETFSGGEAFRINFALRIALSKLLTRRSGAPLPILFIDEGFGTQDSAGQERLKETIQTIQSDFQKIIVITHVEEVKESFPTRIEVTKTSSGSTFVMV